MNPEPFPEMQVLAAEQSWSLVVSQIRAGEPSGMEDLYRLLCKGLRSRPYRQFGPQDLDDKVHDMFLVIIQSIRRGGLRDPERLMGYISTIALRQAVAHINHVVRSRRNSDLADARYTCDHSLNPERGLIERQNEELAFRILNSLPKRDREILIRFYLHEQPAEQIREEMGLSETQYRLVKSRAKARFGELGRRRFSPRASARPQTGNPGAWNSPMAASPTPPTCAEARRQN